MTRFPLMMLILAAVVLGAAACTCDSVKTDSAVATADAGDAPQAEETLTLLYVQTAQGVVYADGVVTLTGVAPATLFFSDRPQRVAGHIPTSEFVATWGEGEDSFASNPPNATLSVFTAKDEIINVVATLTSPRLKGADLVYDISVINGEMMAEGGACSLFIDIIGRPMTPMSVAGVHRRAVRRAVIFR